MSINSAAGGSQRLRFLRRAAPAAWLAATALLVPSLGCGPAVSREELGEVVFETPSFPEQEPYALPELGDPAGARTIENPAARPAASPQS